MSLLANCMDTWIQETCSRNGGFRKREKACYDDWVIFESCEAGRKRKNISRKEKI